MAQRVERWEESDYKLHEEQQITARQARQGRFGHRVLTVLIVALVLAFIVWIPVELWGKREADQAAPQQAGQSLQTQQPAENAEPSLQNGNAAAATPTPAQPATPAQQ
ncbi:hypothetical protein [Rhizobium sp. BK251]|uniref:hypothetical protein n=1 Tax=Rhizobium sp. BK251 TaxID=2512125 RepID=UPI0010F327D1|nr:hypothetical protein [Rhizobium sp. BK251]TCL71980.1 hypothetical protein EV286_105238 [Rhizobium sp. BK251]